MTTAIILAGGLGTRLRSVMPDLPKPMAPVMGRPFLAHQMDHWIDQGVRRFILAVGYRHEAIAQHFGTRYRAATLEYSVESQPLGTGGALLQAAAQLPGEQPVLLLNGDTYFDVPLPALAARAMQLNAHWCLALFRSADPTRYMGVDIGRDGRVRSLRAPRAPLANGGVIWFRPGALGGITVETGRPLSLENDVLPSLLVQGQRFAGLELPGAFLDIGVPDDYHRAAGVLPGLPSHVAASQHHAHAHHH
ncbi:MAG TPA: sugar phosphate nucleotidyltransferase [Burkholderiaceae bacterium]|jgi:D-glycero-alpha-D-manno-heptose 1-phosphate guanylyltransferase